jgi:TolB-like protein/Tfp pilus assembly protein PilF
LPLPSRLALRYVLACLAAAAIAITLPFVFDWGHIRQRWSSAATSPRIESVAVLPLQNLSRDPEQEYFSDGMTDELITELAKFGRLRVISHTSVERYKGAKRSLPEIARELGVDAIVEGTVVRAGDRVRITAQLIEARSDRHLWAESYERDLRDVLGLQDEVAERIATAVGINLAAGDQTRMGSTRVVDSAAHEAYLKGNFYWNRSNCEGSKRALEYFQQAVDKDSNFAPAYLGLAQSYFTLGDWGCWPHHEAFAKSKAQALRAIELDHNLGAAYTWLGMLAFFYEWEWQNAEKEFRQAIELDPNYSFAHLSYAVFLVTMGKPEQAFVEMRRAHELDPTSELTNMVSVHVLYLARQYDQAIEQAKVAIELNPGSWGAYIWLGESYERKGMYEQASAAYLKSKAIEGLGPEELAAFRSAYLKSGIRGHWQQELATVRPNKCSITVIYAHLGDKDRTLEYLNRDFQNHCSDLRMLNVDAIYDSLRKDSRFQDVLHRMKFPG